MPVSSKPPESGHEFLAVGRIIRAHGVRGELKIVPLSNIPGRLKTLKTVVVEYETGDRVTCEIERVRGDGDVVIVKFAHVETREDAETFRHAYVLTRREEAPPLDDGSYYDYELVGMAVIDESGNSIGTVQRIESYPSIDLLVIEQPDGLLHLPALRDVVLSVDTGARTVIVTVPDELPDMSGGGE